MRDTMISVKNLGTGHTGDALRRGRLEINGESESVGGSVVMRYGENSKVVIGWASVKVREHDKVLPTGIKIMVSYDRSGFIERAIHKLKKICWRIIRHFDEEKGFKKENGITRE